MILNKQQEEGLKIALERYRNKERLTVIAGYAGTGKSTLVKFIINELACLYDMDPKNDVCYAAFTGKAAQVLSKKGNPNVSTLHKLLYKSVPRPDGSFMHIPVPNIDYKIVIVDEVSMAPKKLMTLLLSHINVHVICLGDPFQLPPIDRKEDNGLLYAPHIFLTEIMRQEFDSEIIRLSMQIRNHESISYFKGEEVNIVPSKELNTGMLFWADQVLVGTNKTRSAINNQFREMLGRSENPEDGDKVICLRNYWETFSENDNPLVNGTIGYLKDVYGSFVSYPKYLCDRTILTTNGHFETDSNDLYENLSMDTGMILTGKKSLTWQESARISKVAKYAASVPLEFEYGYAITGHKAQGSEYDKVLIIEESFPFEREEHARWLYTCVTRGVDKVTLVR